MRQAQLQLLEYLPDWWGFLFFACQLAAIATLIIVAKMVYRAAAIHLFKQEWGEEPAGVAPAQRTSPNSGFKVVVATAPQPPWLAAHTVKQWILVLARTLVHLAAGLLSLAIVQHVFLPAAAVNPHWLSDITIPLTIYGLFLAAGIIGFSASGLWIVACILGLFAGLLLFVSLTVVFMILSHLITERSLAAAVGTITATFGMYYFGPYILMFVGIFAYGLALATHTVVHLTFSSVYASAAWKVSLMFWAVVANFWLPVDSFKMEWIERLLRLFIPTVIIYAALSTPMLATLSWCLKGSDPPRGLLYLRTFTSGAGSGRFFRRLVSAWREVGPVYALNGPDIVSATMDSQAVLRLVTLTSLEGMFIAQKEELSGRLAAIKDQPGWDGAYKIEEVKCRGAVWKVAFLELLSRCDVALMDLRGFQNKSSGTAHELKTIISTGATNKVLFLVNAATDLTAIRDIGNDVLRDHPQGEPITIISATMVDGRVSRAQQRALYSLRLKAMRQSVGPCAPLGLT